MDDDPVFNTFLKRGQSLGLEGDKLMKYIQDCFERDQRAKDRDADREAEIKAKELEAEIKAKELEAERTKEIRLKELEAERAARELEGRAKEIDLEQRRADHMFELERLKIQSSQTETKSHGDHSSHFGSRPQLPKLPSFKEKYDDIDSYLFRFENHAKSLGWKSDNWVIYLSALLEGSALTLYHSLAECGDITYEILKDNLLRKFQCTAEGFRRRLREARPVQNEPLQTYGVELKRLLDRWIALSGLEKNLDGIINLILSEQFLESVSKDLATFIREKNLMKLDEMIKAAESYRLAHPDKNIARKAGTTIFAGSSVPQNKGQFFKKDNPKAGSPRKYSQKKYQQSGESLPNPGNSNYRGNNSRGGNYRGVTSRGGSYRGGRGAYGSPSNVTCYLCKEKGHYHRNCSWVTGSDKCFVCQLAHPKGACPFFKQKASVAVVDEEEIESASVSSVVEHEVVCSVQDYFTGKLHLESGSVNEQCVSVLRDTGATICGVRRRLVKEEQMMDSYIKCISFGGRIDVFQLAKVKVDCPYFSGELICCILDNPVADLIVGNIPGLKKLSSPECEFSCAVVTRARAKHIIQKKPLCEVPSDLKITRQDLIDLQRDDQTLHTSVEMAKSGEVRKSGVATYYFFFSESILFRSFSKNERCIEQVVVPSVLRPTVLSTAHDLLLAGHCGTRRTLARVLNKFWWPNITVDVAKYVASCDICQKSVAKGRVPPVPLHSVPAIGTPFDRVAIDLVGPINPASEQGHRYILTMIDIATRYPEAVPMKDITSVSVAEELLKIFSRVGFPKEILSDQGPQFVSDLMKQFHSLCGTKGVRTSPYHPQANGHVERFHGTLKAMLKKIVQKNPKLWHRFLPALLFACRELPSESTGFSPFELLFGRQARGPIALLQETWIDNSNTDTEAKPLYNYLFELKNTLEQTAEIAIENSKASSKIGKKYFDKKAKLRKFRLGEEVLVLLPTDTNKLLACWSGPFPITKVLHPDYKVLIKGKEKVFHANMLKLYIRREKIDIPQTQSVTISVGDTVSWHDITTLLLPENKNHTDITVNSPCNSLASVSEKDKNTETVCEVLSTVGVIQEDDDALPIPTLDFQLQPSLKDEDISMIEFEKDVSLSVKTQLQSVFKDFEDILTAKPGCFSGPLMLSIPLTSEVPVRRRHYDMPFSSKEVIEREVQIMLDLGVIEPSTSPYSSPVVLVRKKDESCRFCIDYRALNKVIVFDAEPIPDVEDLFTRLADKHFFTRLDLAKGYWQIFVKPEDRPKTAFSTHMGLFQFIRMPFGLVSAPAVFARMMRMLKLEECSSISFFDDILVSSVLLADHSKHVRETLSKLRMHNLTVRPSKIQAGFKSLEFLGHVVGSGVLRPVDKKIQKILTVPTPTTRKQVRSLLGLLSFYRRYVPNFASLTSPLSDLTKEQGRSTKPILWSSECEQVLHTVQLILSTSPVLLLPRLDQQFIVRTDASSVGLGAVLLQESDDILHPVCYASRKLLDRERNYSTIERECLAIVWAMQKFSRFLYGTHFVLQTDHRPLTYLKTSQFKNSRIMRWALSLQEYAFVVEPVAGSNNVVADLLSRSCVDQFVP